MYLILVWNFDSNHEFEVFLLIYLKFLVFLFTITTRIFDILR